MRVVRRPFCLPSRCTGYTVEDIAKDIVKANVALTKKDQGRVGHGWRRVADAYTGFHKAACCNMFLASGGGGKGASAAAPSAICCRIDRRARLLSSYRRGTNCSGHVGQEMGWKGHGRSAQAMKKLAFRRVLQRACPDGSVARLRRCSRQSSRPGSQLIKACHMEHQVKADDPSPACLRGERRGRRLLWWQRFGFE